MNPVAFRTGTMRGPSAHSLFWPMWFSYLLCMLGLVVFALAGTPGNGFVQPESTASFVLRVICCGAMGLFPVVLFWCFMASYSELKFGYTTRSGFEFVERRDPRSGVVLRAAGEPAPRETARLKRARAYAIANPVAPAAQELPYFGTSLHTATSPIPASSLLRAPKASGHVGQIVVIAVSSALLPCFIYLYIDWVEYLRSMLFIVAVTVLAVVILVASVSLYVRSRNSAVRGLYPSALLLNARCSEELQATVRALQLSPIPVSYGIVWAIDEDGISLWKGGSRPVRAFHLTWLDVVGVREGIVPDHNSHIRTGITFSIVGSSGRTYDLPFTVLGLFDCLPLTYADVNIRTVARISTLMRAANANRLS